MKKHNAITLAKKVEEIKQKDIPGKTTQERVKYLMDNFPFLEARHMADILNINPASVHTARWKIRNTLKAKAKTREKKIVDKQVQQSAEEGKSVPIQAHDPLQEITIQNGRNHVDIWDEMNPSYYEALEPLQSFSEPEPIPGHTNAGTYEIALSAVDGATARSLLDIVYSKITDNKKYCVHLKVEEQ